MRILLVEDDRDIVRFLKKGLLENGYAVEVNFDGETGLRSALRRGKGVGSASKLQVADLVLELDGHRVFRENRRIELTPKEYALLEFFMRHPRQIITRGMIAERIFDYHFFR